MDILDLTITSEMTENGPWWSATLYWSTDEPAGAEQGDLARHPQPGR